MFGRKAHKGIKGINLCAKRQHGGKHTDPCASRAPSGNSCAYLARRLCAGCLETGWGNVNTSQESENRWDCFRWKTKASHQHLWWRPRRNINFRENFSVLSLARTTLIAFLESFVPSRRRFSSFKKIISFCGQRHVSKDESEKCIREVLSGTYLMNGLCKREFVFTLPSTTRIIRGDRKFYDTFCGFWKCVWVVLENIILFYF